MLSERNCCGFSDESDLKKRDSGVLILILTSDRSVSRVGRNKGVEVRQLYFLGYLFWKSHLYHYVSICALHQVADVCADIVHLLAEIIVTNSQDADDQPSGANDLPIELLTLVFLISTHA